MQRYRSGYNGPDSKSGVPARVPWVRIPPAAPAQKFPPPFRFPPAGRKTALWWEFLRFHLRTTLLGSQVIFYGGRRTRDGRRGTEDGGRGTKSGAGQSPPPTEVYQEKGGHTGPPLQGSLTIKNGRRRQPRKRQGSGSGKRRGVDSMTAKTPASTTPRAGDIRVKRSAPCRAPVTASPCFSLLDRARPVFSFHSGNEKRKWGVQ